MNSLETLVILNSVRGARREQNYARALNAGSAGNAKHSEKVGGPLTPQSWIEDGEWEARKRKKRKAPYRIVKFRLTPKQRHAESKTRRAEY